MVGPNTSHPTGEYGGGPALTGPKKIGAFAARQLRPKDSPLRTSDADRQPQKRKPRRPATHAHRGRFAERDFL